MASIARKAGDQLENPSTVFKVGTSFKSSAMVIYVPSFGREFTMNVKIPGINRIY